MAILYFSFGRRAEAKRISVGSREKRPRAQIRKCTKVVGVSKPCREFSLARNGRFPSPQPTKNALLSTKTKVRFLNDVCLRQMMLASPMMTASPNDVCLRAHRGKHRIIAKRSGAASYLRSKCIISPWAMYASYRHRRYII